MKRSTKKKNRTRAQSSLPSFLTQEETKRLFAVIKHKRDRAIFLTAYRHGFRGCLRRLLLVMCTYPHARKVFMPNLTRTGGDERQFGCNLLHHIVLASHHQHFMTEAPLRAQSTS